MKPITVRCALLEHDTLTLMRTKAGTVYVSARTEDEGIVIALDRPNARKLWDWLTEYLETRNDSSAN